VADWWCERAWIDGRLARAVAISVDEEGVIAAVDEDSPAAGNILSGVVFPGFANTHSHAFHRALRGRTHDEGDFWTWREAMYRIAGGLDPDSYHELAVAVYAEMALAGFTCVGEFHYLHHQPGGQPYDEPNAMGHALKSAAAAAGVRLTLLDTCYLTGGIGRPLDTLQERFSDGDAATWAERAAALGEDPGFRPGAAIHSVRAVPAEQIPTVVDTAEGRPLHVHVSEQPAENEECRQTYGVSPTGLLAARSALGPNTTFIHATHLSSDDIELLSMSGTGVCMCPTTERDLGDGIGPAWELAQAGVRLSLGTDQHALVDPFEEARGVEMNERLVTGARGLFSPRDLIEALTLHGYQALGWRGGGLIAPGSPCDLVAVADRSVRTAGALAEQLPFVATAADVTDVVVGGRAVVTNRQHRLGDVASLLERAITPLWG
jgi:formiminoglutamate deiminase